MGPSKHLPSVSPFFPSSLLLFLSLALTPSLVQADRILSISSLVFPPKLTDFWESGYCFFFFFLKFGSWRRASAISILCGKYRITVNYIEKLDSFTAVIIYLPICLRELAAGEKIKCNLGKKKKKSLLIYVWQGESLLSEFTLCQSGGFL